MYIMDSCINYKPSFWHFFVPTIRVFNKSCTQMDKSLLILVNIIRILFIVLIILYIYKVAHKYPKLMLLSITPLIIYLCVNWILLLYTISHRQKYTQ